MIDLTSKPFFLDEKRVSWVVNTLQKMSIEEKIGQLFCCVSPQESNYSLLERYQRVQFGGVTFRPDLSSKIRQRVDFIQGKVKIPLLVSANLENGGNGIATDGTLFGSPLQIAATGDPKFAYQLGDISGKEGSSIGINQSFAPVVDLHLNWRNPIIVTRTFGNHPDKVIEFAGEYIKGIEQHNVSATIKHFPGDGVDERDHHLLTSVNSLSYVDWEDSFGKIYKTLIDCGVRTVMVGHILLPAYSKALCPEIEDKYIKPASISPEILKVLLRKELGFNGVIMTDSAVMSGLGCALKRKDIPTAAINAGCDMILFGRNLDEDYQNLLSDAKSGRVSHERVDEAVTRILALKASLNLNSKCSNEDNNTVNRIRWVPFACGESPQYVNDIPTLFVSLGNPYHFVDVPMIKAIS